MNILLILSVIVLFGSEGWASHTENPRLGYSQCDVYHVHHPPDPVNLRNQNFYLPGQDLFLPCYGFPTEVRRSYNSLSKFDGPFGYGWTYSFNVRLIERKGYIEIVEEDGFMSEYVPEHLRDVHQKRIIDTIVDHMKQNHIQNEGHARSPDHYATLKKKLRADELYYTRMKEDYIEATQSVTPGKYYSTSRGSSMLTKFPQGGYLRETLSGQKEYFNEKEMPSLKEDRNGNRVEYTYTTFKKFGDTQFLRYIKDPCGRKIEIMYSGEGKIAQISDSLGRTFQYRYDKKNRLIKYYNSEGKLTQYGYDDKNRMNRLILPDEGGPIAIEYDKWGKVSKIKGPGKKVTTYKFEFNPRNRNHYWITVKDNKGYFRKNEYIEDEFKMIETEKGKPTQITTFTACCGKPLSITDPKGQGTFFSYDKSNNMSRRYTSDGQTTLYDYEPRFSQIRNVKTSDGLSVTYDYDDFGNLAKSTDNTGNAVSITYNKRGKIHKIQNTNKNIAIVFDYNDFGKPTKIEKVKTGSILVSYDPHGNVTQLNAKKASETIQLENQALIQDIKLSLMELLNLLKPAGISLGI